jgi:hypothetical protein
MAGLRLVPFNATWISHDKIDIHAIYRRPRFKEDKYGEQHRELDGNGMPTWDIVGPLPIRRHNDWEKKGFQYVTLANRESLAVASRFGTLPDGTTMRDFDQHQSGGPWSPRLYAEGMEQATDLAMARLESDVRKYGSEVVENVRRGVDPEFSLPEKLRGILPDTGGQAKTAEPQASGKAAKGAAA